MRDFRDAKAMAHALRNALKSRVVEITHGESLELIARAFGYENWNILAAKIEAATPSAAPPPSGAGASPPEQTLYCSFCIKSQHDVKKLIAGPSVYICDECVELCMGIIRDDVPIWKVLELIHAAEKSGSDPDRAALDHLRGRSAQELTSYMEQCRGFVEHNRQILHFIQRRLAMKDDEVPARDDILASPRFAYLKEKTTEELRAMRQGAQLALKRYQEALRLGATVLAQSGQQMGS
jgi:hypothetical protein